MVSNLVAPSDLVPEGSRRDVSVFRPHTQCWAVTAEEEAESLQEGS